MGRIEFIKLTLVVIQITCILSGAFAGKLPDSSGGELMKIDRTVTHARIAYPDYPQTQASQIHFSATTTSETTIAWTNGDGNKRLVFMVAAIVDLVEGGKVVDPGDSITYEANTQFGDGAKIENTTWCCVYNGTGNSVVVTGLTAWDTYTAIVVEYNGDPGFEEYFTEPTTGNPAAVRAEISPTITSFTPATAISGQTITITGTNFIDVNDVYLGGTYAFFNVISPTSIEATVESGSSDTVSVTTPGGTAKKAGFTYISELTWTGSTSSSWGEASNWSPAIVPTSTLNLIIPSNAVLYPVINAASSPASCNNLTINAGVVLTVLPGTLLNVSGMVENSDASTLIIKSDATGDGSYIGPATQATVERYIPKNGWHLVSSPVADVTNELYTGMYMKQYNETTDAFGSLVTENNVPLIPGTGSIVWSTTDKTISFTGTINAGPVAPSTPKDGNGFTLAGNPFTAPIDWNAASGWTKTNIVASTWVWNQSAGNYAVWDGAIAINNASRYIAMGQGFFVQATESGASLSIPESARNGQQVSPLFRSVKAQPELLRLTVNGNGFSDEAVVMIATDALTTTDYRYDALKMSGSADAPQLSTIKDGKSFTIASLSSVDSTTVIPVTLKTGATGTYTLNLANTINTGGLNTFLIDKISGTATRADLLPVYSFTSSPYDIAGRFEIVFRSQSVITTVQKTGEFRGDIKIWNSGRKLNIEIPSNEQLVTVEIYNLNGNKVKTITTGSLRDIYLSLNTGMYIVSVKTTKQVKINKIVFN